MGQIKNIKLHIVTDIKNPRKIHNGSSSFQWKRYLRISTSLPTGSANLAEAHIRRRETTIVSTCEEGAYPVPNWCYSSRFSWCGSSAVHHWYQDSAYIES